eukprot:TRINITY_DN16181_c0_g1_i2.p1 TRINITY_DN16181_c0_g1~~TRINITY_DN16181_c0_g1_i2.p1  ORF type:complete len:667 (-),score=36.83 TRINITY_DN16181_c0_g1_i2:2206-4077(-)
MSQRELSELALFENSQTKTQQQIDNDVGNELVTFSVCGDFANQRLAILYGFLIAMKLKRTLVIPRLPLDGKQGTENNEEFQANSLPFYEVYDKDRLSALLQEANVQTWQADEVSAVQFHKAECGDADLLSCISSIKQSYQDAPISLDFGCTFPSKLIPTEYMLENENIIRSILENLIPAQRYQYIINHIIKSTQELGSSIKFNAIHLRPENEWIANCTKKSHIEDGEIRDNCLSNTDTIGDYLEIKKVDFTYPLFIATQTAKSEFKLYARIVQNLNLHKYHKIQTKEDVSNVDVTTIAKDQSALIDYFVAMEADRFVGNAQSLFTSLLIFERQALGKWASYYNNGEIPLANIIPLYKVPMITYAKCQDYHYFQHATEVALRSGAIFGDVEQYLFCLGHTNDQIVEELKSQNIKLIPKAKVADYVRDMDNVHDVQGLVGITLLDSFSQYNYVIFTGPKMLVRKPINLNKLQQPLPTDLSFYYDVDNVFSGQILVNTYYIRKGFSQYGLNFVDSIQMVREDIRYDEKFTLAAQFVKHDSDPTIITFNQVSIGDLEVYLISGFCPDKLLAGCEELLQNGCRFMLEFSTLNSMPQLYPSVLRYCNYQHQFANGQQQTQKINSQILLE